MLIAEVRAIDRIRSSGSCLNSNSEIETLADCKVVRPAVASLDEVDVVVAGVVLQSTVPKTVCSSYSVEYGCARAYWWDSYVVNVSEEWLLDGHVLSLRVWAE